MEIKQLGEAPPPHLWALVTAPAKYGKTTLLSTLPKPLLVGDVDGGILSLMKDKLVGPEVAKHIFVAKISSYADAREFFEKSWKGGPEGKPFASLAFDTFSWLMSSVIKPEILAMSRREKMEKQDWGLYLERGLYIARLAHQVARDPNGAHVVLACHESDKGGEDEGVGKLGPAVSGQLFDILPGMVDFSLFLRIRPTGKVEQLPNGTRRAIVERVLQTVADARTPAGSRADVPDFAAPDLGALWERANGRS